MITYMQYYLPRWEVFNYLDHCLDKFKYEGIIIVETYSSDEKNKTKLASLKKPSFEINKNNIAVLIEDAIAFQQHSKEFFSKKNDSQCRAALHYTFTQYGEVAQFIKEPDIEPYPKAAFSEFKIIVDENLMRINFSDHIPLIPHSKKGLMTYYQVKTKN